jgi:hypothetical protein
MSNIFDKLRVNPGDVDKSISWYKKEISKLSSRDVSRSSFFASKDNLTSRLYPGQLYLFAYDPKHKNTLPYYDTFPLLFPFRKLNDGFIGYNLHYLPPVLRFKIMGVLMNVQQSKNSAERKLAYSYGILNSSSLEKYFAPCIKRYLSEHLRSYFFEIPYESWLPAALLPTENFVKASKARVWRDSTGA